MSHDPAVPSVKGAPAEDRAGTPLGTVDALFLDDSTGELSWVVVGDDVVVPATGAEFDGARLRLAVDADTVRSAPRLGGRAHLDAEHLQALRTHYSGQDRTRAQADVQTQPVGRHSAAADVRSEVPGPAANTVAAAPARTSGTDGAMTLSEERLAVRTELTAYSRAVLRIETVTEQVMVPVTVTRQQARIEYLPPALEASTDRPGQTPAGEVGAQATPWVTLYSEEPVVELRRVPVERVRLATAWTEDLQEVSGQVRREEIALDGQAAHA